MSFSAVDYGVFIGYIIGIVGQGLWVSRTVPNAPGAPQGQQEKAQQDSKPWSVCVVYQTYIIN